MSDLLRKKGLYHDTIGSITDCNRSIVFCYIDKRRELKKDLNNA